MSNWECYCAICGGPFYEVQITKKSKSARARRRQQQKRDSQLAEKGKGDDSAYNNNDEYDENNDEVEGEDGYDAEIINEEETQWVQTLHIIGFDKNAPGVSKSYISGPGSYQDFGEVEVEPGDDPNFDNAGRFSCYYNFDEGGDVVFPFHWPCYMLLVRVLTGTSDLSRVNKDIVYSTFQELYWDRRLKVDYGEPEASKDPEDQFWYCVEGEEVLVSNPSPTSYLEDFTKATIASYDFKLPSHFHDITTKVTSDPFEKLHYDLIYRICITMPSRSVFDLSMASKQVFTLLNMNTDFWKKYIKYKMPWFFELQNLLDDTEITEEKDLMGLFRWANRVTEPKEFMEAAFMPIANRRRIWGVCEQIADTYFKKL